jgi:threonine dehydrogenase-like Zn-dependent dehydrogenase
MATMRAVAVTPGRAGSARLIEVERPEPVAGEALVRVLRVGVCGTDREIVAGSVGRAPAAEDRLIIGHESFGVVERVNGASAIQPGDRVAAIVRRPDGCAACRQGRWDMCMWGNYTERGIRGHHGYMAGYYVERPEFLVSVPESLHEVGVLVEPTSVIAKAISQADEAQRRLPWQPQRAVVCGAGPIGLLATLALRLRGLETHTLDIVPPDSTKAELVRACGATYVDGRETPLDRLAAEAGNIDLIIEATGFAPLVLQAMNALGINGALVLTGVSGGSRTVEVDGNVLNLNMVMGNRLVVGSVNACRAHFDQAVRYLEQIEARWPGLLGRMITRAVPLDGFEQALAPDPNSIKSVVQIGDAHAAV